MPMDPSSVAIGKCYVLEPDRRVRKVVRIKTVGKKSRDVQYTNALKPKGTSIIATWMSLEDFAQDVIREV